jgi:hypothetical protein
LAVVKLAFFNVWRRLSRSILALLAMAIAASVLTSGLSLSRGLPNLALTNYREIFQGEIVAFSPGFVGAGPVSATDTVLVRRNIIDSGFNLLLKYYPALQNGYYAQRDWEYRAFTAEDMNEIASIPGVTALNPFRLMPAKTRGENVELKIWGEEEWPQIDYDSLPHDFEVVLNSYGAPQIGVGDFVDLSMPHYAIDRDGIPYIDITVPQTVYRVRVVGKTAIPTRSLVWANERGETLTEQAYVHSPDVYLRENDWLTLWERHSDGAALPVLSLGITVENMSELNLTTQLLQEQFPGVAFISIPDLVRHLDRHTLLDRFYYAPPVFWRGEAHTAHPLAQQDFGHTTAILLFLNAGMLLASQMLTAVAGRRNEIGILKAIGSRQREVVGMIIMEAVIIALIGSSVGFLLVRSAGIHLSVTNGLPLLAIVATTLRELGLVLGLTVAMSLAFGVLPAWKVARLTVMEVFRNE